MSEAIKKLEEQNDKVKFDDGQSFEQKYNVKVFVEESGREKIDYSNIFITDISKENDVTNILFNTEINYPIDNIIEEEKEAFTFNMLYVVLIFVVIYFVYLMVSGGKKKNENRS